MTIIPSDFFDPYHTVIDELLTNDFTSYNHTIYYPAKRVSCSNCLVSNFGGISKNVYRSGGAAPFQFGSCPLCGGNGYKEEETTTTIRTRVYWEKKDWIKRGGIDIANSDVMILGKSEDLKKIMRMSYIKLNSDQNTLDTKYVLDGAPFYHGFGHRYFVAFLKQS